MFISSAMPQNVDDTRRRTLDSEIVERAGILDRRRVIHIFHDQNISSCKVIQINISTTKGSNVLFDQFFMNRNNGTLTFVAVYVYDCTLNLVGKTLKEQFEHGRLTLLTAKRIDRETDYDRKTTHGEAAQLFSKVYNMYHMSDYVDSRVLVHPYYYTQEHEYCQTNDFNPVGLLEDANSLSILGSDIMDDVTEIYQQNPDSFVTVRDTLMMADTRILFGEQGGIKSAASDSINEVNYLLGCDTLINGGVFVYDSQMGMSFDKPSILCKKYMVKEHVGNEMETFMTAIDRQAKLLETNHGSIRMFYAPSLIGSKCRVIFKDSNNAISDHGLSNASKDSSHEVTETIGRTIEDDGIFVHKGLTDGFSYTPLEKHKIVSMF